ASRLTSCGSGVTTGSQPSRLLPPRSGGSSTRALNRTAASYWSLAVTWERQVGRTRWQPTDRLLLAAISRALPRPAWRSLLPSPETLLRWHRELVRRKGATCRRRPGRQRPVPRSELHDLINRLATRLGRTKGSASADPMNRPASSS